MSTETITTVDQAKTVLDQLAADHEWVSVFWNRGWGDSPTDISIIVDGDGQNPRAQITRDVYTTLVSNQVIGANTYVGFKARRIHDYKAPPIPVKTGPRANDVAEEILRDLFAAHDELPLKTAFHRGIRKDPYNPIIEDTLTTGAYGTTDGYVNVSPGACEAYVSAWTGTGLFGDRIGDGVTVQFPVGDELTSYGSRKPDLDAMRAPGFREAVLDAIRSQFALLSA